MEGFPSVNGPLQTQYCFYSSILIFWTLSIPLHWAKVDEQVSCGEGHMSTDHDHPVYPLLLVSPRFNAGKSVLRIN